MKILFSNYAVPRLAENGGESRMLAIIKALAETNDVTVYATDPELPGARGAEVCAHLIGLGVRNVVSGHWNLGRLLAGSRFDLLYCEFWHVAELLVPPFRAANPRSPVVVDSVDLHFVREEAGVKIGSCSPERAADTRHRELAIYREADLAVTVTREDDSILHELLPGIRTVIVPIIVPLHGRRPAAREKILSFIGNFNHPPNADGIAWFGREIWPAVKQSIPDAKLEIVGRDPPPVVKSLGETAGIHLLGWVPETAPCLDRAAISIAPLRFGGGMKVKVTEALAHGLPVVSTSFGVQGFGGRSGEHYRVADDPADFAQAVVDLLQNPTEAQAMGLRGQFLVERLCSPQAVDRVVTDIPSQVTLKGETKAFGSRLRFQLGALLELAGRRISRQGRIWMRMKNP